MPYWQRCSRVIPARAIKITCTPSCQSIDTVGGVGMITCTPSCQSIDTEGGVGMITCTPSCQSIDTVVGVGMRYTYS